MNTNHTVEASRTKQSAALPPKGVARRAREMDLLQSVHFLQAAAGNSAVTRLVQQFMVVQTTPAATAAPVAAEQVSTPAVSPEVARRLAYSATILRRVQPLPPDQQQRLTQIIGETPTYALIKERDAKREELNQLRQSLDDLQVREQQAARGDTLSGGVPPSPGEIQALSRQIDEKAAEIKQLDQSVRGDLARLGIAREDDLVHHVEVEFPERWIRRAKQIAMTTLEQNREVAQAEMDRYTSKVCSPDVEGLRLADKQLNTLALQQRSPAERADIKSQERARKAEELERGERLARDVEREGSLPGGVPPSAGERQALANDIAELDREIATLQQQSKANTEAYNAERNLLGTKFPVLLAPDYQAGSFYQASEDDIDRLTGSSIKEVLNNIKSTKQNIADDTIKVWDLHDIPAMTYQDLRISEDSVQGNAVKRYIQGKQSDAEALNTALSVLAIGAGIIAVLATGGVALVGALAAGGIGLYQVVHSAEQFAAERAASRVSIDPEIADISANEPQLLWLVMDIVGLALDVGAVVKALRPVARAMMATGRVERFAAEARRVAPDAADRLINTARREVSGGEAAEAELRRAYKPSITGDPSLPAGEGSTNKFGDIVYSTQGSATDQALVRLHEQVHSFLSPKLMPLRTLRADLRMAGYQRSSLLKYLEEALAESYAQVKVHGWRALPVGLRFPVTNGYVQLSRVLTEAAIGTVVWGGMTYGVYVVADRAMSPAPASSDR